MVSASGWSGKMIAAKNSLLTKLENSNLGAEARTLHSTALALCYSTAKYWAAVLAESGPVKIISTQN